MLLLMLEMEMDGREWRETGGVVSRERYIQ
jgi:hypothetical protein